MDPPSSHTDKTNSGGLAEPENNINENPPQEKKKRGRPSRSMSVTKTKQQPSKQSARLKVGFIE